MTDSEDKEDVRINEELHKELEKHKDHKEEVRLHIIKKIAGFSCDHCDVTSMDKSEMKKEEEV